MQPIQNNSPSSITHRYASWFDQRINEFINDHKGRFEPSQQFRKRNGFFVTISFDHNRRSQRQKNAALFEGPGAKSEMDTFTDLYNFLCRDLISRNYHRPSFHALKPLAIGCLDMNGSRYWKSMGELENPHIHSIWIFSDKVREKFQNLLADEGRRSSLKERFSIQELNVQPLDHNHRNSTGESRVSSYMAKFMGHNNSELSVGDDFRVLPVPSSNTEMPHPTTGRGWGNVLI